MFNSMLSAVGGQLLDVVLPALASVIGVFIVGLLNKHLQKAGIEVKLADKVLFEGVVTNAIRRTEETARRHPMSSEDKRATTIAAIEAEMPRKLHADVSASVDSQIQVVRTADTVPAPVTIVPSVPVTVKPTLPGGRRREH